ncbi:MAG TPA: amidohydrolase family protein, partial [Gemmatimonadaceae bacterium]|nr:amidohydrolase family protein [Gemmatimonadaceae bacterium]
ALDPRDSVIDAGGLALAPGFIDTHSHHDRNLAENRGMLAVVSQGVTTIIVGQDGGSRLPLARFFGDLEATPVAANVASYVGHGTVRDSVMGEDFKRAATPAEVERMKALVAQEMGAGALGLSSGLEYDPGIYSDRSEVVALAKVAADSGGRYISHIRSEDRDFWSAVDEIIRIGAANRMPVQISHGKLAMRSLWGQAPRLIAKLDSARAAGVDITMDVYPYQYWQSTLTVLYPQRDFSNRATTEFVLREVAAPEGLLLSRFEPQPEYAGKTVAEISKMRNSDPATTLEWLIATSEAARKSGGRGGQGVIGTSMDERDIAQLIAWPHSNICSDGELQGRHPRGFGSFPRVLGRYVREQKVTTLPDAVRRMTSLAAAHVGLRERGTIAPGYYADLVLFDPDRILDRATPADPQLTADGISSVWVNGRPVYANMRTTGNYPGRVLRRGR